MAEGAWKAIGLIKLHVFLSFLYLHGDAPVLAVDQQPGVVTLLRSSSIFKTFIIGTFFPARLNDNAKVQRSW